VQIEALEGRQLLSGGAAKFSAVLLAANEVPAVQSPARGMAKFTLSRDGTSLRYKIKVARVMNAEGAHIHLGGATENGEIVADLMSGRMKMGRRSFSAAGVITAAQLMGSLAGHSLADLLTPMMAGTAYVNVHTDDGVAPANTGPGDFPNGEVRGQLHRLGKKFAQGGQTGGTGATGGTGGQTGGTGGQTGGTGSTGGQTGGQTGGTGGQTGGTGGYYNY
jgi:hypothetical protein